MIDILLVDKTFTEISVKIADPKYIPLSVSLTSEYPCGSRFANEFIEKENADFCDVKAGSSERAENIKRVIQTIDVLYDHIKYNVSMGKEELYVVVDFTLIKLVNTLNIIELVYKLVDEDFAAFNISIVFMLSDQEYNRLNILKADLMNMLGISPFDDLQFMASIDLSKKSKPFTDAEEEPKPQQFIHQPPYPCSLSFTNMPFNPSNHLVDVSEGSVKEMTYDILTSIMKTYIKRLSIVVDEIEKRDIAIESGIYGPIDDK